MTSFTTPEKPVITYAFVSLGCPKNLVDSEKMLGNLALEGYTLVPEPEGADFVIINTCGFIEASREESRAVIREMIRLKRRGKTHGVIVAGCLPQRLGPTLLEEFPEIDHVVGVFARDEIQKAVDRLIVGHREQRELFRPAPLQALDDRARLRITPRHYAYLKISEGCDRTCTFCAIPRMRGKHLTKPFEMVLDEARELARDGVRELILVAQDTTYYGLDLYGRVRLAELLRALETIDGIDWIRLMYLYPINFTAELISTIAQSAKIIPYLDLPLQHINDQILRRMQRRVNGAQTRELLSKLRASIPGLVIRTTFITGFPGETEAQFEDLVRFVEEFRFERLGVFAYSREPGTPADRLEGHLPVEIREARRARLMEVQQPIAFSFGNSWVGKEINVLIDGPHPTRQETWIGRAYFDAPDIDGVIYVKGLDINPGDMVRVCITRRQGYDLAARKIESISSVQQANQPLNVLT